MMRHLIFLFFMLTSWYSDAQLVFTNVDDLLIYATKQSITLQSNDIRLSQAKKTRLAAILGVADPVVSLPASFTNNTRLPVNIFPADAFGGVPGTFKEVQTGVQYNTNFSQNLDIKLINLAGWENLKLSKLNIDLTQSNNLVSLKSMHENISINFYNIVTLQEQLLSTQKNEIVADTLYQIALRKYDSGLGKQQDVNDSKISLLNTQENIRQIQYIIEQSYVSLKILCDIPESQSIIINYQAKASLDLAPNIGLNPLSISNSMLQEKYAFQTFQQTKKVLYPTLSFVSNNTYQLFNQDFSILSGDWINSNYIGLKLNFNLPTATTISNKTKAFYDYQLAKKNVEQAYVKASLDHKQLSIDLVKAKSQNKTNQEILSLRKDTYSKNVQLYNEGLVSLDQTLHSFNDMVTSEYNLISSNTNFQSVLTKIDINNKIK